MKYYFVIWRNVLLLKKTEAVLYCYIETGPAWCSLTDWLTDWLTWWCQEVRIINNKLIISFHQSRWELSTCCPVRPWPQHKLDNTSSENQTTKLLSKGNRWVTLVVMVGGGYLLLGPNSMWLYIVDDYKWFSFYVAIIISMLLATGNCSMSFY